MAVDGSGHCFGGLKTGIAMARKLNRPLEVISTFDPYFHYAMFNSLTGVLSKDAAKVFKFEQQEKLHEDIIDKGLAKIYQSHLEVSRKLVEEEGMDCTIRLLDGKVFEKILQYAREEKPYLLILGRIGVHSAPDMDIGGNTENLLRMVPCNVLLSSKVFKPPIDLQAEESIDWTAEAKERLKKIPGFVRPMATAAILRYSLERGHSMITSAVITEACESILPAGAMQAMYSIGDQMRDKMAKGEDPLDGMIKDRQEILYEKFKKDAEEHAETDGREVPVTLKCGGCGAYHPSDVVKCSVCGAGAELLVAVDKDQYAPSAEEGKDTTTVTTFDSVQVTWTQEALDFLEEFPEGHIRRRAHARIEKNARVQKVAEVSLEFAKQIINGKAVTEKSEPVSNGNGNGSNGNYSDKNGGTATQVAPADVTAAEGLEPDVDGFTWAPEAVARLEQVPKGFMRDNTRSRVIDFAKKENITHITYETCVKGIEYSVQVMSEMIQNGATIEDFLPGK